jgi:beta-glucosidase
MVRLEFPKGFLWGSATSAHQVEGNNRNDWSEWEQSPARMEQLKKEGLNPSDFISNKACDSYNRYEEDFDIVKNLNQNIHRFSIEWSRIEPEEGHFDENEMGHYKTLIDALRARGVEPMVTLWHYTNPTWFTAKGGFLNEDAPEIFIKYVKYVVDNLKDRVGLWITFNEAASVYSGMAYLSGPWPPQQKSFLKYLKVQNNFIKAHTLAYREIKNIYKNTVPLTDSEPSVMSHNIKGQVGAVENFSFIASGPLLRILGITRLVNYFRNYRFFKKTLPYQDFIGFNYYRPQRLPGSFQELKKQPAAGEMAEKLNWEIYPAGIYTFLKDLKKFNKPIYITENGIADRTDNLRLKFIKDHLYWIHKAISDGVNVRGYIYWSLLDNFEWSQGFYPRFGLVEVNYQTMERKIRPSAFEYARISKDNALEY